ncbi:MAG: mannitol-1-phosphate 5-dehydrogenase [Candidatus Aerophobetes bacterium]|nr:mannitol-1-phosphate 5-dehydrogenase [Candidatus Aerophobetes bacterium]
MKKAIQFGAGNIGRGFLGQLFNQSNYETVFVEIRKDIIACLNREHSYQLKIVGRHPHQLIIDKVRAVDGEDKFQVAQEIREADIMATAVGARNLPFVASLVAKGMRQRADFGVKKPINLIICENLPRASNIFKKYLLREIESEYRDYLDSHLGLVEAVVSRMVPVIPPEIRKKNPTFIMVEEYSVLPVDKKGFKGEIPKIKGMAPYENLHPYEEQKLFIHNTGHAICAYLGYLKGYKYIWQAIEDNQIRKIVQRALEESGKALIKKHGFTLAEQHSHIEDILERLANRALGDTIARVGRDPIRKLGPDERLIGSAKLALQYGIIPENISKGIASALFFDREDDEEAKRLTRMRKKEGINAVLKKVCRIDPEGTLGRLIKKASGHSPPSLRMLFGFFLLGLLTTGKI